MAHPLLEYLSSQISTENALGPQIEVDCCKQGALLIERPLLNETADIYNRHTTTMAMLHVRPPTFCVMDRTKSFADDYL